MIEHNSIIKLKHSTVQHRKDGIVEIHFLKNSVIDVKECEELLVVYDQILENKEYPLLHITEEYVTFTKEARAFSATKRGLQYSRVEAYVFTSLAHKIIANFYIKFNKPPVPTRFFRAKKDAEEWLKKYL